MSYAITSPKQFAYLTNAYADPIALISLCNNALGNQFQTQNARTTVQQQFNDIWKELPTQISRFPIGIYRVYRFDSTIDPLITSVLNSFDTRNRIIETENPTNPSTTEVVNATQRVDDATVNIRSSINNLCNELIRGTGFLNQATFEEASQLTWTARTT
uniref:Capsid protein n=1 Tax=Yellow tailflower mild mottle virus TaxID=1416026 RepID=A0A0F6NZZ7_9VIRU|nr:coat protein [Yellow tailflower mild mottle virus]